MNYYQEIIERLQEHNQSLAAYNDLELAHTLEDATTAIETLLAEREAEVWISTKKRTPKDDDDGLGFICMTSANGRSKGVMELNWEVAKVRGRIVRRWIWHGKICPWEVTHWRPLPTPPDQERTER